MNADRTSPDGKISNLVASKVVKRVVRLARVYTSDGITNLLYLTLNGSQVGRQRSQYYKRRGVGMYV